MTYPLELPWLGSNKYYVEKRMTLQLTRMGAGVSFFNIVQYNE